MQMQTQVVLSKYPAGYGSFGYVVLPAPNGGLEYGELHRHEAAEAVTHDKVDEFFRAIYDFCGAGVPGPIMANALGFTFHKIWKMLLDRRPPPELIYIESIDVVLGTKCSPLYPFDASVLINSQFYTWVGDPWMTLTNEEVKMLPKYKIGLRDIVADKTCPFCLVRFKLNQLAIQLPCGHFFDRRCIATWLKHRCDCPYCKVLVRKNGLVGPGRGLIPYGYPQGGAVPVNTMHFIDAVSLANFAKNQLKIALGPNSYLQMAETGIDPAYILTQPAR